MSAILLNTKIQDKYIPNPKYTKLDVSIKSLQTHERCKA